MSDEDWDEDWDEDDEDRDVEPIRDEDAWYRGRIDVAFAKLEQRGYLARACHLCCAGCAGCDLANQVEAMTRPARATVLGAVFYHEQDAEGATSGRPLMIRFGPIDTNRHGKVGLPAATVGADTVAALRDAGLTVSWDGDASQCIEVTP